MIMGLPKGEMALGGPELAPACWASNGAWVVKSAKIEKTVMFLEG
jgi:hypothetical protein